MKYLKSLGFIMFPFLILSFLVSWFYYLSWVNPTIYSWLKLIIPALCFFVGGLYLGKHSKENGWLEGFKLGGAIIFILFMISYLGFDVGFSIKLLVYYLILFLTITFGSMVGIRNVDSEKKY